MKVFSKNSYSIGGDPIRLIREVHKTSRAYLTMRTSKDQKVGDDSRAVKPS